MTKLIFMPFGIVAGVVAGVLGKNVFRALWGLIDDEEAPKPKQRRIRVPMLALALIVEGALFRVLKGLADHGSRRFFASLTGAWPGEERPEPQ
jgi:Protein of unknown function (DUF4235)